MALRRISLIFFTPLSLFFSIICTNRSAVAQDLLEDRNGDQVITVDGFGDSITYGTGDGTGPNEYVGSSSLTDGSLGYLRRVRTLTGIRTNNLGKPGEMFTERGIDRLPGEISATASDVVAILEGSNDARFGRSPTDFRVKLQRAINVIRALGKEAVLFTVLPPCCNRAGGEPLTRSFSNIIRDVANVNDIVVADIERAWNSTCPDLEVCPLYNRPEGLHPNTPGYDAIAQVFLAALANIDIFSIDGQQELADALGIDPATIIVVPDVIVAGEEAQS